MDHVLVVDDSKAINRLVCAELRELGDLHVESAADYATAKALLAQNPQRFLIAVLDLDLPDAPDGEIVDLVRGHDVPVVVLTGSVDVDLRRRMFAKKVADYEIKTRGDGIARVVALIERRRYYHDVPMLVVDDSGSTRMYVAELLERHGYRPLQAADGREALAILASNPDIVLVVTDYHMPGMNGAELAAEIRRVRPRDELVIIGLSSGSKGATSVPLLKSGANDFVRKPFEIEEFYARIDQNLDMLRFINETREVANRDFLTRLNNRRAFFHDGERMYADAGRNASPLAAVMIDLDHFKRVNDRFGHDAGDAVLVEVARTLRRSVRESDLVARFGGEEFVCLLGLEAGTDATLLAEDIRRSIEASEIRFAGRHIPVTASIGVTCDRAGSLKGMLKLADDGVYAAKEGGRNRVVMR